MASRWGKKKKASDGGAALIVLEGPDKGSEFALAGTTTVGRTQDNTFVRLDRGVSRRHVILRDEGGVLTIEDLGSANGTLVNDKKVEGLEVLRHGDRILIGETTFLLHWPETHVESGLATSPGLGKMDDDTQPGELSKAGEKKKGLKGVSKRKRLIIAGGGVVGLVLFFGLLSVVCSGGETFVSSDQSSVPVQYSDASSFLYSAFGYGPHDDVHPDKAIIMFQWEKGRMTLRYSAWDVDQTGEVVILVNGNQVGDVPTTQEFRHEVLFEIPHEALQPGENELIFDNTLSPPDEEPWEVGYVRLVNEPYLPPNQDEAQVFYQQALRLYEDREVDPANRFRAFQKLRRVRDLLEKAEPRPPLYDETNALSGRIVVELQDIYELGRFSAERAFRFGDADQAHGFLTRTIAFFPEHDDIRREQLSGALEALGVE